MSIKDLSAKSPQELNEELLRLRREQFNLRMGAAGQPAKPDQFRRVRRSIARVKTVLNQKRAQGDGR